MKTRSPSDMVQRTVEFLDHEHATLISGKIDDLSSLTQQKEKLIQKLKVGEQKFSRIDLSQIQKKSLQNARLYQSVLAAQKSVIERLTEITKAQKTIGTYGIDGSFKDNTTSHLKLEKRS
ncbi:MAG: hypothetical protein ABJ327_04385 [Litoreibacter sp.]